MVDSERVWVELYYRSGPNSWQVDEPLEDLEDILRIEPLNVAIPLNLLYEGIEFKWEE